MTNRIQGLDVLRSLAIIFVFLGHYPNLYHHSLFAGGRILVLNGQMTALFSSTATLKSPNLF